MATFDRDSTSSCPVRHRHPLTDIEKGEIIIFNKDISHTKISKELGIPPQTISNFLEYLKNRYSLYNLLHLGRPRQTSATADQWFVRTALAEAKLSFKEFKSIAM
jgi:predicted AAA+ superfamily ATPase